MVKTIVIWMAVAIVIIFLVIWALTGGIGAAFLGHAITRIAIFLTTGHAGIPKPRGTEDEEVARRRATPKGWQVLGPGEASRDR